MKTLITDEQKIQEKVVEMNDRTFSVIKERETIAGKQRRMITMQKEEQVDGFVYSGNESEIEITVLLPQLEYESEDVLNRVRAYFDDAAGMGFTLPKIADDDEPVLQARTTRLKKRSILRLSNTFKRFQHLAEETSRCSSSRYALKFCFFWISFQAQDFSDEYDDNAAEIEKYEATSKIRPLLKEYFEMKKKKLQEELKADEKAAAAKFEDIEKTLKTTQEMKLKGKAFTKA